EGTQGLFTPMPSLDAEPDLSRSLEAAGGGWIFSENEVGRFLVADGEQPTLTRYEIGERSTLVAGTSLSFASYGVSRIIGSNAIVFASPNKAYFLDTAQLQAIIFDPAAMIITGTVSLAGAAREGFATGFGAAVTREDAVYFPAMWFDDQDWDDVPAGSMLVRLDLETDEVTMTNDARCAGMARALTTDAGDTYWFSSDYNTMARRGYGPEHGVPDCALRLRAGDTAFDPDWQLDLASRTGGYAAIPNLPAGGSSVWLRVLDESAATLPTPADFDTLDAVPAWQWYVLDLESNAPAMRNDERPLSAAGGFTAFVDGRAFTSDERPDLGQSVLIELTPAGFVERATLSGLVSNIVRVR
ncbi:MAG TPA: hypothetical protein VMG12_37255, partial [Polyangiaceae bacterium]|nr:hypothetical protein [Polyangiaceae bacterium]